MKTFEKEYGKYTRYLVSFNNGNEYIECGPGFENPKFEGILIRKFFSGKGVEFYGDQIKFFLKELKKIPHYERLNRPEPPLIKLIHKYGWRNCSSDFAIVISDYDSFRVKFFMRVSHQFNSNFEAIKTSSPEFRLEEIIEILEDANELLEKEENN